MVYYGIDMNMETMQIVNLQLSEGYIQSEDIRVICLDWQKAYYESIFGKGIFYASIKQEKLRKRLGVPELRFYQTMP